MYIKNIVYCFFFLFIYSCIPYKSYQKNDAICEIGMGFHDYEKIFDMRLKPQNFIPYKVDSGSFFMSCGIYSNATISLTKWTKDEEVSKLMEYDTLGRIKFVGWRYSRTNLGTSYLFDTLGNITKTIDERQADKYPICFREALEIVKRKTPKHYTIRTLERTSRLIENKNKQWYYWIIATGEPEKLYWYVYYINAKTGRVFKKFKSKYVYD